MSEQTQQTQTGWVVTQSIAMELDTLLAVICGQFAMGALPAHMMPLIENAPADWLADLPEMTGGLQGFFGLLIHVASWSGVLECDDYNAASLAMRQTSVQMALARLQNEQDRPVGSSPEKQLAELQAERILEAEIGIGLLPETVSAQRARYQQEAAQAARLLQGGDLSTRFWHWLDRYYYQIYLPWRESQHEGLAKREQQALTVLGERSNQTRPPDLEWLPQQNPLVNRPALNAAVRSGSMKVLFWIEPFGIADLWAIFPGMLISAIAEPGVILENFFTYAGELAARAQALADPTRLAILRMIRHFGMTNTEIAAYLGISRPTVSVHAKILREAGLIDTFDAGRAVQHKIKPASLRQLFADLVRFLDLPEE